MSHDHGPPPGEEPRWLDDPANMKKLTRGFFIVAALLLVADVMWLFVHKHATFFHDDPDARSLAQDVELWPGFYPIYSFVGIVLLVALSVVLRKLVMRPEDYYSRDYADPNDEFGGAGDDGKHGEGHHG